MMSKHSTYLAIARFAFDAENAHFLACVNRALILARENKRTNPWAAYNCVDTQWSSTVRTPGVVDGSTQPMFDAGRTAKF